MPAGVISSDTARGTVRAVECDSCARCSHTLRGSTRVSTARIGARDPEHAAAPNRPAPSRGRGLDNSSSLHSTLSLPQDGLTHTHAPRRAARPTRGRRRRGSGGSRREMRNCAWAEQRRTESEWLATSPHPAPSLPQLLHPHPPPRLAAHLPPMSAPPTTSAGW